MTKFWLQAIAGFNILLVATQLPALASSWQLVRMDSGKMTRAQFYRLGYLAPGQSARAMRTWQGNRYPWATNANGDQLWKLSSRLCVLIPFSGGRYAGYRFQKCGSEDIRVSSTFGGGLNHA